ncbi:sulfite reductase flavoprotein subunit alpha [Ferruginibacter sp.]|uniref:diflavin oxidoreductase n=1 Tax=Ferruginibacter sp. TaxID=1940288 RepID=UPI00374CC110
MKLFLDLLSSANKDELIWMNGYLNGVVHQQLPVAVTPVIADPAVSKITIVYGTETGNSKRLAGEFAAKAKQQRIHAKVVGMDQYRLTDLAKEEYLLAIVSTHGEGEPPIAAKKFYDHIHQNGFRLEKLKYSVLALGDTSYPLFCKTGEEVDEQFNKLGGNRIAPLQKCDVEYDEEANSWFSNVLKSLSTPAVPVPVVTPVTVTAKKTGKQIYTGTVLTKVNLNDRGSNKETWHIEIAAEGVQYQCGDSIGVVPENPTKVVEEIIALTKVNPAKKIIFKNEEVSMYDLLKYRINIIYLTERLVKQYADITGEDVPATKMDLLDLLKIYPVKDSAQFETIVEKMNAISPRLYTIASAPAAHDGEVHILAVKDAYTINDEKKFGLCSSFLGDLQLNAQQKFFIQANKRFRMPADEKDMIMVGPGTGIAAFRSFLSERDATGATGKNWLFFGDQHFASDFLYQTEIQNWLETGVLTKVNVAFSRDQHFKLYVQHKMLQHAAEVYEWINSGASFFICGTKDPMSIDVENTLLEIIQQQGNKTKEEATHYLELMEEEGRYEKDVY